MESIVRQLEILWRNIVKEEITAALSQLQLECQGVKDPNSNTLLNFKDTTAYIGVSKVTIYRWMKDNKIGHYRVGRRILFSMEKHIIPFLSEHEIHPKLHNKRKTNRILS